MAEITAALVKAFRDKTGLPMMDCKKALAEADGDAEKALTILREKGKLKMIETLNILRDSVDKELLDFFGSFIQQGKTETK